VKMRVAEKMDSDQHGEPLGKAWQNDRIFHN
jgi:hypothetical protein